MAVTDKDIYTRQLLMSALEQVPPAHDFLHQTFFGATVTHTTPDVKLDIYKGKRHTAKFVNPIRKGNVVERDGYITKTTRPAYIKEMRAIRPSDTQYRAPGENPYVQKTPEAIAEEMVGKDMRELDSRISRLEETMCAQALFNGEVIVKGDGWDASVEFGYTTGTAIEDNIKILSGSDTWDAADAKPLEDIDKWRLEIIQRCGISPTHCIISHDVAWPFIKNAQVKEIADNLRFKMAEINPQNFEAQGICDLGFFALPTGQVKVSIYNEWYIDSDGKEKPMVPSGTVLLGSNLARCEMHYGMIQNMNCLRAVPRWPHVWTEDDGSARWVQLESAPMPNIFQPDAFTVAKVLGGVI